MSPLNTVLLLCGIALVFGLLIGKRFWAMTETEVINAAAAEYLRLEAEEGRSASLTDCVARPMEGAGSRLRVLCKAPDRDYLFEASRWGVRLMDEAR